MSILTISIMAKLFVRGAPGLLLMAATACSAPQFDGREQRHKRALDLPASITEGDKDSVRGAPQMPCIDKPTFLSSATITALEVDGWRMFTCSDDDVVFRRAVHDPILEKFDDPEELGIARYARVLPGKIEQAARRFRSPQSAELAAYMRSRFNIPEGRHHLRYDGILADGRILASATVSASESSYCEFSFPDNPNPQTTCESVVGIYLIQLRSHSVNYGDLEQVMDKISSVLGK